MKNTLHCIVGMFSACCVLTFNGHTAPKKNMAEPVTKAKAVFTPTRDYKKMRVHGFQILVNPEVMKHSKEYRRALAEIKDQLKRIKTALPKHLKHFRKISIWLEWQKDNGSAAYHPSKQWLIDHGCNPDRAQSIEITNAVNFTNWSKKNQPWLLLHELAHAYHHMVLGHDYQAIHDAYDRAMKTKLYDKSYASTNYREFFSELTEAYLGNNDVYPHNPKELKSDDPQSYDLIESIWGTPRGRIKRFMQK